MAEYAWSRKITGALCMDVATDSPSVARDCLLRRMRELGIYEGLVGWTPSFLSERSVRVLIFGQEEGPIEITTSLPQGS